MTVLDVDTEVYKQTGNALVKAADAFFLAVDSRWDRLADTGENMCGSYEEARTWAGGYDVAANDLIDQVLMLAKNVNGYGNMLIELGWLHEVADHNANMAPGPPPAEPVYPSLSTRLVCRAPLPSAGGPGNGLIDGAIGLLEEVGITIPDGDTDKLWTVSAIWSEIGADQAVSNLAAELDRAIAAFEPITSPELGHIDDDLRGIREVATAVVQGFTAMATTTTEHHDSLVQMRKDIEGLLRQFVIDTGVEMAVTAAVSIAASFITFGAAAPIGAAVGAGRVASLCKTYGPKIRPFIQIFKSKGLGRGFKDLPRWDRAKMEDIWARVNRAGPGGTRARTNWALTPEDVKALQTGQMKFDADGVSINQKLYRGEQLTPDEQRQVDALNQALGKMPPHEGPVVRHVNLRPDQLGRYEEGQVITENGFVSTSMNPNGTNPAFAQAQNTEIRIAPGGNGVKVGEYSGLDDEVLYPSGTKFFCTKKFFDESTGKVVVELAPLP